MMWTAGRGVEGGLGGRVKGGRSRRTKRRRGWGGRAEGGGGWRSRGEGLCIAVLSIHFVFLCIRDPS